MMLHEIHLAHRTALIFKNASSWSCHRGPVSIQYIMERELINQLSMSFAKEGEIRGEHKYIMGTQIQVGLGFTDPVLLFVFLGSAMKALSKRGNDIKDITQTEQASRDL